MQSVAWPHWLTLHGRKPCRTVLLLLLSAWACFAESDRAGKLQLTLEVDGVRSGKGVVGVLVFHSAEGWPTDKSRAVRAIAVPAIPPSTVLSVPLPAGEYAVVVLHDENENTKLDRNWLGVPKEQWGMSRNPHAVLAAPAFESAQFALSRDLRLRIALH